MEEYEKKAKKTEIYFPVWEARNVRPRCQQGWFLLSAVKERHAPLLFPNL